VYVAELGKTTVLVAAVVVYDAGALGPTNENV